MIIKYYKPKKSGGFASSVTLKIDSYAQLPKGWSKWQGRFVVDGKPTTVEELLTAVNNINQDNEKVAQQTANNRLTELKNKVSSTCSDEEAKLFWLLYSNLKAEASQDYYNSEVYVSLTYKGIPLDAIRVKWKKIQP